MIKRGLHRSDHLLVGFPELLHILAMGYLGPFNVFAVRLAHRPVLLPESRYLGLECPYQSRLGGTFSLKVLYHLAVELCVGSVFIVQIYKKAMAYTNIQTI